MWSDGDQLPTRDTSHLTSDSFSSPSRRSAVGQDTHWGSSFQSLDLLGSPLPVHSLPLGTDGDPLEGHMVRIPCDWDASRNSSGTFWDPTIAAAGVVQEYFPASHNALISMPSEDWPFDSRVVSVFEDGVQDALAAYRLSHCSLLRSYSLASRTALKVLLDPRTFSSSSAVTGEYFVSVVVVGNKTLHWTAVYWHSGPCTSSGPWRPGRTHSRWTEVPLTRWPGSSGIVAGSPGRLLLPDPGGDRSPSSPADGAPRDSD